MTRVWAAIATWLVLSSWLRLVETPEALPSRLLVAITLVALAGHGLRRLGLAVPFVVMGQLLVALLTLQVQLGQDWLPTAESMRMAVQSVVDAVAATRTEPAPVGTEAASIVPLLLVAGVAVHLAVDVVLVSLGRALLGSLPLLVAWVVPVSVLGTATPWPLFALAAVAWLCLLAADEGDARRRWGRQVSAPWLDTLRPGPTAAVMGGMSLLAALALPGALPHRDPATVPGTGAGRGGTVTITDPVADLRRDLTRGDDIELLRVSVSPGAAAPSYVRLSVLDAFDDDAWRVGPRARPASRTATGNLPHQPAFDLPGEQVRWQVAVSDAFASVWLPVPRWAIAVDAGDRWRYDREAGDIHRGSTARTTTAGIRYEAVEFRPQIEPERLAAAQPDSTKVRRYTRLPDRPTDLRAIADEVTRGAGNDYERAVALQRFFQEEFHYSTDQAPGTGMDALLRFLQPGAGRVGYCEQFAASMALLARELGMPARVAVGFLRPQLVEGSTYAFSAHDLHAWPEIWFAGAGWVGFEPTPTSHTGSVPTYTRAPTDPAPTTDASPTAAPTTTAPRPDRRDPGPSSTTEAEGRPWLLPAAVLVGVLTLALACIPRLARGRQRRRRLSSGDIEQLWDELLATTADLGSPAPAGRSPRATVGVVRRGFAGSGRGAAEAALDRLVLAIEESRYAPGADGQPAAESSRHNTATCLEALRAERPKKVTRRADWWPRSLTRTGRR